MKVRKPITPKYQNNRTPINKKPGSTKYISEANFLSNIVKKGKSFIKDKMNYIKKNAKKIFRDIKKEFMQPKSKSKFKAGNLIAFTYDAKFKDGTIWDKKPLIICLGWSQNPKHRNSHFFGLNIHHLNMKERVMIASFFTELNDKKGGVQYNDIKPFMHKFSKSPRPVLRQYIYNRVAGKVIVMPKDQFLVAASIPSEVIMRG